MPKIPDDELDRLKREVDLVALVRSKGIELKPHGGKDLVGLSPFSAEKTPSFIVTPGKNLWHCMSTGQGGSVIDFVMKHDGVSFRHAALLLKDRSSLFELRPGKADPSKPVKKSTTSRLEAPVSLSADDREAMADVLAYYRQRLQETPAALNYLKSRGITEAAIERFGIGYADRTLGLRLPMKNRKDGAAIRERLLKLGIYRDSGHEHFNGCVVFPIADSESNVSEIYGRRIGPQKSGIYHLYLPGPHRGLFNPQAFASPELILTESVIDALSFWCNGFEHVSCIWGTEGFSEDHLAAFKRYKPRLVWLAYDNDPAGNRAAEREASRLGSLGIDCRRVRFPMGQDPNEYVRQVVLTPPSQALQILLNAAEYMEESKCTHKQDTNVSSSLVAKELAANVEARNLAAKDKICDDTAAPASGSAGAKPRNAVKLAQLGEDVMIGIGPRSYRLRGLEKNHGVESLKVNLRVMDQEGRFHLDLLDLCRSKDRESFIRAAADETHLEPDLLKRDLGKVLLEAERLQEERLAPAEPVGAVAGLDAEEEAEALELLRSPDLLKRIVADMEKCGIVGESTNKLTGYLAAVSRKLEKPLAVIVQSTSAAGKTSLMEAVLSMMPEEDRVKYSAMTGQSLYYLGETELKHKILAIVEEEGAEKAAYALKLLQSEGELTIASTGKDDQGRMKTEEYHVEGPVMIFLTTTAIDIDEELLNRCLVLTVDETREQTKAIHAIQREAETFEGLQRKVERDRLLKVHRNAQRLLKPVHVVNPFAPKLTFLSDRTRTRRDHVKYLTLIRTIALLHQHQRPRKEDHPSTGSGQAPLRYIEATLADIEAANRIAHEVLGRSLDELPPQTRRLLGLLVEMVAEACRKQGVEREHCLFTRRRVREFTGWSEYQVRVHLNKLQEMEYVCAHHGGRGQNFVYELLFDGDQSGTEKQCVGLLDVDTLRTSRGEMPASRGQRASNEHGSGSNGNAPEARNQGPCGPKTDRNGENTQQG